MTAHVVDRELQFGSVLGACGVVHAHVDASLFQLIEHLQESFALRLGLLGSPDPGEVVVALVERTSPIFVHHACRFEFISHMIRHRLYRSSHHLGTIGNAAGRAHIGTYGRPSITRLVGALPPMSSRLQVVGRLVWVAYALRIPEEPDGAARRGVPD